MCSMLEGLGKGEKAEEKPTTCSLAGQEISNYSFAMVAIAQMCVLEGLG